MYPVVDQKEMSAYPASPAYPAAPAYDAYPASPAYPASAAYPAPSPYPPPPVVYAVQQPMPMPASIEFDAYPALAAYYPPPAYGAAPYSDGFSTPTAFRPQPAIVPAAPAYEVPSGPAVFGPDSVSMTCPHCNVRINTAISKTHKTCTHLCCCCMFLSVICTICSCTPYCCCDPESVEHTCPNCSARLGVYYS